jgi:hypothetical protein
VGACREGCFHAHAPLHIHMITMQHPPPTQPPLTAPWHPALSAISPPLAPSHHAASTDHRLPPPRLITTAGKCFHPSARALSLLGSRSHAASQQLRTSACAPRHCYTNTVVCRARRTRGSVQSKMALCHSARERHTQLSACSGTVLDWVCVCTLPQGAQLRAAGWRAARGGTALVQAASSHAAARHTRHTAGTVRDIHQHGRTVAS